MGIRKPKDEAEGGEAVGPKRRQSSEVVLPPSVLALSSWTVDDTPERPLAIVLPGPTHFDRQAVLKQYVYGDWRRFHSGIVIDADSTYSTEWLNGNLAESLLARIALLTMPVVSKEIMAKWHPVHTGTWEVLWSLVAVEEFIVEEPLRQLIDKQFYLVHDVHRILWEVRFLAREHPSLQPAERLMNTFTRWLTGDALSADDRKTLSDLGIKRLVQKDAEKFDVACFLLSLACQNGLLERAVFLFDDLEHALQPSKRSALRHVRDLLDCARRWSRLGSNPLGILIGFTGSTTDLRLLDKYNGQLAVDVRAGLAWTRRSLSS